MSKETDEELIAAYRTGKYPYNPSELISAARRLIETKPTETQKNSLPIAPPAVIQGDTRGLSQRQGLHTPTMAEIIANANKPDPTAPYLDTNSDFMREINPLKPHWSGGEFPRLINPLKPGPKMPTNG